jgi:hypothetical protein
MLRPGSPAAQLLQIDCCSSATTWPGRGSAWADGVGAELQRLGNAGYCGQWGAHGAEARWS